MQNESIPRDKPSFHFDKELALEKFFETSPLMMGIADVERDDIRHIYDNQLASKFFNVSAESMPGMLSSELGVPREVIDLWIRYYLESERANTPVSFEYKHPGRQVQRTFSVIVSYMGKNPLGAPRFSYIAQDVTETKVELLIQKTKLECLLNASPIGVAFLDTDLRYEIINPVLAELNGVSVEDHINKTVSEVIPQYPELIPKLKQVLHEGKRITNWEFNTHGNKNGLKPKTFLANYFPVLVEGKIIGIGAAVNDMTFKRQAEEDLKENELRYRLVVEGVKDYGIIRTDLSGEIVDWNTGAESIFQLKKDEVVGKSASIIFTPEDRIAGKVEEEMETALDTGKAEDKRWHIRSDGSRFFANGVMSLLVDSLGNPIGYVKVLRDETEQKQNEDAYRKSQNELHSFFMEAPAAMVILTGPDHFFTLANPVYEKLVGRKVSGKKALEAFTKEEIGFFLPLLDGVYNTGIPYIGNELPLTTTDENGKERFQWINLAYHPYKDANGKIEGIFAFVQDITGQVDARKKIEHLANELANERYKLESIFQQTPAAVAFWSGEELRFEMVNPVYQNLFKGRQLLGLTLEEAIPESKGQDFAEVMVRVFKTGESYFAHEAPTDLIHEAGGEIERRYFDFSYVQIKDVEGNAYGVYNHALDVTDRVESQKSLAKYRQQLEGLVEKLKNEKEMRDRFVAALSHDLRSPLTAAKMSAQLLARNSKDIDAVNRMSVKIVDSMNRADSMIRDLLDSSRIKAGEKLQINLSQCDLGVLASETIDELSTIHGDRFKLSLEGDLRGHWSCNGLRRIIENLCSNAIKYGSSLTDVRVMIVDKGEDVQILVHNEGNPIPKDQQDMLFEPFRRAESAESSMEKGWGLGLTLVKGLAEAHKGSVSVESASGIGTRFLVRIPKGL